MQIWAEPRKSALPICNYSQILYQFLTFTQNLKRSLELGIREFTRVSRLFDMLLQVILSGSLIRMSCCLSYSVDVDSV